MMTQNAVEYFRLARKREAIRRRRAAGEPWPWSDDPIFREWRFTNVCREYDATTVWFREHVRSRLDGWRAVEATIAFRFFNRIATGEAVEDLLLGGWNRAEAERRLRAIEDRGQPLWTGAYRIRGANGTPKLTSTLDSIDDARRRPGPLAGARRSGRPGRTCARCPTSVPSRRTRS